MSNLIRNRWLRRTLFLAGLIALGVGIYHFEPPEPMCVIEADGLVPKSFAGDGERFVTLPVPSLAVQDGPLQIWDSRTGAEVGTHFKKGQMLHEWTSSKNGQRFATETVSKEPGENTPLVHVLHLVNLSDGTALELAPDDDRIGELRYTPAGDVLARLIDCKEGKELQVYDSATGQLLAKHVSKGLRLEELTDEAVPFRTPTSVAGYDLEIWSVPERRMLATVRDAGAPISSCDGKFILFSRLNADGEATGAWGVWSMQNLRIEAEFQIDKRIKATPIISPDNRWLALISPGPQDGLEAFVELRDFPSGRPVAKLPRDLSDWMHFSPDGRWLAMDGRHCGILLLVAETPTLEVRWEQADRSRQRPLLFEEFSADSRTLFAYECEDADVIAYGSETGAVRRRIRLASTMNPRLRMTPDHRALLAHQTPGDRREGWLDCIPWISRLLPDSTDCVIVIDTNSARERFRLADWDAQSALLSDDGNTLVTQHADGLLRCWEVNAWKPLYLPIGVPAGLAAAAFVWTWWRRRRSRAKAA